MSSIKRVIGLGVVASAMVVSGLVLASNHGGDPSNKSHQHGKAMQQRMGELKAKLAITAAQEGAWGDFQLAMQRPAKAMGNEEAKSAKRDAMKAMTTPQRLDAMLAMKQQRDAYMTVRTDAIRSFYTELTPSQQTVFDNAFQQLMGGKKMNKHRGRPGNRGDHDDH